MIAGLAWICSILGFILMYVIILGLGMSTVPGKLTWGIALGIAFLPSIAGIASLMGFYKTFTAHAYLRGVLVYSIPLLLSIAAIFPIAYHYGSPWVGWIVRAVNAPLHIIYTPVGNKPFYQLEIRLAEDNPGAGFTKMTSQHVSESVYVAEDVLFTNEDVAETWFKESGMPDEFIIGMTFTDLAQPRVEELSHQHVGKRWAILLNDELFVAPKIVEPFQEKVVLSGGFNKTAASNYARGIVQEW